MSSGNSSEQFVNIHEIRGPIVILKDGSLRVIVEAMSVNFDLKSADEKTSMIVGFQNFLNSVDFPMQIVIDSRKLDISNYIASVELVAQGLRNELLKVHANEYMRFVSGLTDLANVVSKKFYLVIPYYATEIGVQKVGIKDKIKNVFTTTNVMKDISNEKLQKYILQLDQRVALVRNGVEQMGVKTKIIEQDALATLYYNYYNPRPI